MFDDLKEDSARKLGRLERIGSGNQDMFRKIQENQGNLHQRVTGLERAMGTNQVDVFRVESVEGKLHQMATRGLASMTPAPSCFGDLPEARRDISQTREL